METSVWDTQLEVLVLQAQQAELNAATQRVSSLQAQLSASNEAAESAQDARKALLQQLEGSAAHETATLKAQLRLSTQEIEAAQSQDNRVQLLKEC